LRTLEGEIDRNCGFRESPRPAVLDHPHLIVDDVGGGVAGEGDRVMHADRRRVVVLIDGNDRYRTDPTHLLLSAQHGPGQ
jgi:hypothetical protein